MTWGDFGMTWGDLCFVCLWAAATYVVVQCRVVLQLYVVKATACYRCISEVRTEEGLG